MISFIRFVRGYVRICIQGAMPQRFLNLCSVHGISLWNIVSQQDIHEMNLSVSDYFKLRPIVKKTKTKVVLKEKKGLPFCVQKWKKRKVFILCSVICVFTLYALSLFIWDIKLTSQGRLTQEMLLSFLQDEGVTYGSLKKNVPIEEIEKRLRDEYPFIIWTSISLEGTRLLVNVKENELVTLEIAEKANDPTNLIATVDGTVASIVTRSGIPQVKAGDNVKKGDLLIVGEVPIYNDDETIKEYMYVPSDGEIRIRTEITYKKSLPLLHEEKVYTGEKRIAYYFRIYNSGFSTASMPEYENYDIVTDLGQAKLLNDFYIPLYYGTIAYKEYEMKEKIYTKTEAEQILRSEFNKFIKTLEEKGVQIVGKNVTITKNGQNMVSEGKIAVEMSDGEPRSIPQKIQTGDRNIE